MINKEEFDILSFLMNSDCFTEYYSKTTKEIVESNDYSESKNYRSIRKLLELKYITEGYKSNRNKTYYLTLEGIKLIKEKLLLKEEL